MTRRRGLDAATITRAAPPVLLLLVAMGIPWLALPATIVLAAGAGVAIGRTAPVAWAWASTVPAAALASARWVSGLTPFGGASVCQAFDAPRVGWSVVEAAIVLGAFTALAVGLRTRRASVGLRRPARSVLPVAVGGFGVLAIGGLVVVSIVNGGVPGPTGADPSATPFAGAVLLGAVAVATAEELAFRGVLQHWLARTVGEWPAIVVQGIAYGVWVAAIGWGPAFGVFAVVAGIVAGAISARTNSLLIAWAWHSGVAVALMALILCP